MKKKILILILLCIFCLENVRSQALVPNIGGQLGLSYSLGTHVRRLGLSCRFYYQYDFVQFNIQAAAVYNFKSLGSEAKGWEENIQLGMTGAWGKKRVNTDLVHPYMNPSGNQTLRPYSAAYAYIFYFDKFGTSQRSGVFGFQIKDFRFYFENDFLAFQSMDKYRSGSLGLFYRWKDWQFALKQIAFTGDPYGSYCPWIEDDVFPSRSGFIDMTSAPLGNKSVGILALQAERRLPVSEYLNINRQFPLDQYVGVELGIDAEQIRNFFQNKLIHDSKVLPLNWGDVKNPHVPMICEDGCPYTYHEGQKIRKPKLYFQTSLNNSILY